ncbi:sensor histidine kinase [Streptomyces sp. SID3343]|uniref:sensor histidine kinase n=1 Tax=Streptomyces sp. SID3343 TaxID=2690260 RepID=UPI00136B349A|nr:sensor histidine kinase [Streptomyces sp. SID3343]MYV97534.1 sensor histidine kinase [Streptomyces sp. SID3343]
MGRHHPAAAENGVAGFQAVGVAPRRRARARERLSWTMFGRLMRTEHGTAAFPWRITDVLVVVLAAASELIGYLAPAESTATWNKTGAVLLAAAASTLLFRRRYPVQVLAAVLVLQVIAYLNTSQTSHNYSVSILFALYEVARHGSRRTMWISAIGVSIVQFVRDAKASGAVLPAAVAGLGGTVVVILVALGVRRWKDEVALNRTLLADRAVAEERRRIARELHDIVAHHVTTMYLMSGGARSMMDRDPDTARAALVTLESSGRTALQEMRQLLGVLRSTGEAEVAPSKPQPGVDDIDNLVAESCAAGLPTGFEVLGDRRAMPLATGLAIYRITQEALTNTRKHAGRRANAHVRLAYLPDRVTIDVSDDGTGDGKAPVASGGYGLLGMRERVAVHGGTFEAGHCGDGGFRVAATIPLPPDEPDAETSP